MHGQDDLGKIDSSANNDQDIPNMKELMKKLTSASWHPVVVKRNPFWVRLRRIGEVPFIR